MDRGLADLDSVVATIVSSTDHIDEVLYPYLALSYQNSTGVTVDYVPDDPSC